MNDKLNKLIDDTLKERNGKWSRKSLTMFVCTIMSVLTGSFIVLSKEINSSAEIVFLGFLGGALGTAYLTVKDKNINKESNETIK